MIEYYQRILLKAELERKHQCPIWETAEGELIPITSMGMGHMRRAWAFVVRKAHTTDNTRQYKTCIEHLAMLRQEFIRRNEDFPAGDIPELISNASRLENDASRGWGDDEFEQPHDIMDM